MTLEKYQIHEKSSVMDALRQLTAHTIDILLAVDDKNIVTGLITDGDLRRGLVSGKTLESPVSDIMNTRFSSVGEGQDRAYLLDFMMARSIRHLPVIGQDKKLKGIHFLSHIIGNAPKPNIAVIMAGGKGLRLRPLTEYCPKPMLKVAGRPILERLVLHLVSHGITNIYISLNYMGEVIEDFFKDGAQYGCTIRYLKEDRPLGSGGALSLLPHQPDHPFIVMNGDLVTDIDIGSLLDFHTSRAAAACIASKRHYTKISYGVVEKKGDEFLGISEKPTIEHEINTGTYVLSPECLKEIPREENFAITELFELLRRKGKKICVFETQDEWIDIGQPDDLKKAMGYHD